MYFSRLEKKKRDRLNENSSVEVNRIGIIQTHVVPGYLRHGTLLPPKQRMGPKYVYILPKRYSEKKKKKKKHREKHTNSVGLSITIIFNLTQ